MGFESRSRLTERSRGTEASGSRMNDFETTCADSVRPAALSPDFGSEGVAPPWRPPDCGGAEGQHGRGKQLGGLLDGAAGAEAAQFPRTSVEGGGRRSTSLIRQALQYRDGASEDASHRARSPFLEVLLSARNRSDDRSPASCSSRRRLTSGVGQPDCNRTAGLHGGQAGLEIGASARATRHARPIRPAGQAQPQAGLAAPQQRLNFLPLLHGHGSLRPTREGRPASALPGDPWRSQ